jgi:hypothetical protein
MSRDWLTELKKAGNPAMPCSIDTGVGELDFTGMTLRDHFASAALTGYLAAHSGADVRFPSQDEAASQAYDYADAMLKARML